MTNMNKNYSYTSISAMLNQIEEETSAITRRHLIEQTSTCIHHSPYLDWKAQRLLLNRLHHIENN